jgi:hypothetical protein
MDKNVNQLPALAALTSMVGWGFFNPFKTYKFQVGSCTAKLQLEKHTSDRSGH